MDLKLASVVASPLLTSHAWIPWLTYEAGKMRAPEPAAHIFHPQRVLPLLRFLLFLFIPHSRAFPELVQMPCIPPFYPSRGHEDRERHDTCSGCYYYVVTRGKVRGVFTNSWIAREMVARRSDGFHKAFKTWREVLFFWGTACDDDHPPGACPPFELVDFTLNPNPVTHPGPPPCTPSTSAAAQPGSSSAAPVASSSAAPVASSSAAPVASSSATPAAPPSAVPVASSSAAPVLRLPARPGLVVWNNDPAYPFTAAYLASRASSSTSSISSASSLTTTTSASSNGSPSLHDSVCIMPQGPPRAGSPFNPPRHPKPEPVSPSPKKEEPQELFLTVPRVTTSTRVQLSPTGHARAAALRGEANPTFSATPQHREHTVSPSPPSTPLAHAPSDATASVLATPFPNADASGSATPSVLATPAAANAGGVVAAPPAPNPARVHQYGVCGVGIFYPSFSAAHAAALRLGLEPKIMVSDNVEKLEAWILGKPFLGDDGAV
ncbi:hypothetical protein C8R43DRAFT_1137475 [Mycena crocata]|nr:hypothetical protein C8R43DRAFT_1137475 [Mycena crocata]